MKYQIILESDEILDMGELEAFFKPLFSVPDRNVEYPRFFIGKFKFLYAQSTEGLRKELWEKKEKIEDTYGPEADMHTIEEVNKSFNEISNLFKLD